MKFCIDKIILWPKKAEFCYRIVEFKPDKINIITGASRTGKSAIIPIIDYCLGSDKCTIPVDTIRRATAWFGVLFSTENEQILLCRKEPGKLASTGEMFISRGKKVEIPNTIESNTTCNEINYILNELFSMSFLALDVIDGNSFFARPSYRDFKAFLFQPQNIVANADVMFYKADTMENRQKLINIFPYVLGAVTPKILAARQELERLKKQKERCQRDLNSIKDIAESWKSEVQTWLVQAKELGLIADYDTNGLTFDEQLVLLSKIASKNDNDSLIDSSCIKDLSSEIISLRKKEQDLSSRLFFLQKRHTEMLQLKGALGDYEHSLKIKMQRLEISTWLKNMVKQDGVCPFCNNVHSEATEELNSLCDAIAEIEKTTENIKTMPAAFERELQIVQSDIAAYSEELVAIRKRIAEESGILNRNADKKYTLSSISRFLGRLESSLQTLNKIGKDSELESKIAKLSKKIEELSSTVNELEIRRKQDAAIRYINQRIGEIIKNLDAEYPDNPVEFLIKDLTIKVKTLAGRDDYLWEIGSASNWLSYHIATILAFQQFFQEKGGVMVPNFIIFDQPSQAYFPQRTNKEDVGAAIFKDEDKEAVKKIFTCYDAFLKQTKASIQIIVTEHADDDIWGDIDSVYLVAKWRGDEKLIPQEWL
ncbi:MAG: DUF3732 domain-containing protein [Clostridia bacterium]|nr:DUF3732 domain-containing protein [Clostridia bacterium]